MKQFDELFWIFRINEFAGCTFCRQFVLDNPGQGRNRSRFNNFYGFGAGRHDTTHGSNAGFFCNAFLNNGDKRQRNGKDFLSSVNFTGNNRLPVFYVDL